LKPQPQHDFPVSVIRASDEVDPDVAPFYQGILELRLNFSVTIWFVPRYERGAHRQIVIVTGPDEMTSEREARAASVAVASYSVTPDDALSGTEELTPRDDEGLGPRVLFYVTQQEFDTFSREIESLGEALSSRFDSRKVSELGDLKVIAFLVSRLLASPHIDELDREMLGR
jgi:hypothetical protein